MTHAQCWDMHERSLRRADRLAGAASVDADVNVGSKKGGVYVNCSCYRIQIQCVDAKEGNLRRRSAQPRCCKLPPPRPPNMVDLNFRSCCTQATFE